MEIQVLERDVVWRSRGQHQREVSAGPGRAQTWTEEHAEGIVPGMPRAKEREPARASKQRGR